MNAVDGRRVLTDLRSEYLSGVITADEYGLFDDAMRGAMRIHAEAVLVELYGSAALAGMSSSVIGILSLQNAIQRLAEKAEVQ